MARLPQPGGDSGNWGAILNDYLSQAHAADGALKPGTVGVDQITTALQSSLVKADTAYQKPNDGIPLSDIKQTELDSVYLPHWKPGTNYSAGAPVMLPAPLSTLAIRVTDGISRSSFDTIEHAAWILSPAATSNILSFEAFGAIGDGVADDTSALIRGLAESAATGKLIVGSPSAQYRITARSGSKTFTNGTGGTYNASYCLVIPNGAIVDWRRATLVTPASFPGVAVSNENTTIRGDKIEMRNMRVDGNGTVDRLGALVVLWGLKNSIIDGLEVFNTSYIAASLTAANNCVFDNLIARDIRGQGMMLGNSTDDINDLCRIGKVESWNCWDYGTFNQPGNGICIGATRTTIDYVYSRNCAGGVKYLKGCDVKTRYVEFDGAVLTGETDNVDENSGIKVQGDDASNLVIRAEFDKITTRNCGGAGLYVRFATNVKVGEYTSVLNARLGTMYDIDLDSVSYIEIGSITSESTGWGGLITNSGVSEWRIGRARFKDIGSVTATNSFGFAPQYGKGWINQLEVVDARGVQVTAKAIHSPGDTPWRADNFRTNVGNRVDIRSSKQFLGNVLLGSGNDPLSGTFTPTAAAISTTINNANIVTQNAGTGYVEPIVEMTPLNAAAQVLQASEAIRTVVPGSFTMTFYHGSAAGTELFRWRLVGYVYNAVKPT